MVIYFYEIVLGATLKLYWQGPTILNQTLPGSNLYYPQPVGSSPIHVSAQ